MPILLLFLLPIVEIYLFFKVASLVGWAEVILWTVISFILGKQLLKTQALGLQQNPINKAPLLLGGFLLMIPGFLTDALGLLFILPGTRHLLMMFLKSKMDSMMKNGQFQMMNFSIGGMPGGAPGGTRGNPFSQGPFQHSPFHEKRPPQEPYFGDDHMVIDAEFKKQD